VLNVLENAPWRIMGSENLQISVSDANRFDKFESRIQNIKSAIKYMKTKPRKGKEPEHDESDGEEAE
jgi:hypothetical protein